MLAPVVFEPTFPMMKISWTSCERESVRKQSVRLVDWRISLTRLSHHLYKFRPSKVKLQELYRKDRLNSSSSPPQKMNLLRMELAKTSVQRLKTLWNGWAAKRL